MYADSGWNYLRASRPVENEGTDRLTKSYTTQENQLHGISIIVCRVSLLAANEAFPGRTVSLLPQRDGSRDLSTPTIEEQGGRGQTELGKETADDRWQMAGGKGRRNRGAPLKARASQAQGRTWKLELTLRNHCEIRGFGLLPILTTAKFLVVI